MAGNSCDTRATLDSRNGGRLLSLTGAKHACKATVSDSRQGRIRFFYGFLSGVDGNTRPHRVGEYHLAVSLCGLFSSRHFPCAREALGSVSTVSTRALNKRSKRKAVGQ